MEQIEIQAKTRPNVSPKHIRKDGFIPAIVYGHNILTVTLAVQYGPFEKTFKKNGESTILSLVIDGKASRNVIIQDVQRHYLTSRYEHIDFLEVSMTETMTATVPLEFVGISKAVKENGGTMVHVLSEVEVECLPSNLPSHIEVDISSLETFDDSVRVSDIKVPAGVTITTDPEETIAKVDAPRDVEAELATPVVEDVSKVEGAAEAKPTEGEAEKVESKE
jgi:large subunit ribosomal protein L25